MDQPKKTKVLIIDDSALVRQTLSAIINSSSENEVIATAADPYIAVEKMKQQKPDVITLDIQMPQMDGLTFLKKLMNQHPIPVVVVSGIAQHNSDTAIEAYKLGAISVIEKPKFGLETHEEWKSQLLNAIYTAARSKLKKIKTLRKNIQIPKPKSAISVSNQALNKFVLIGSSSGGTEVIAAILSQLPKNTVPILIVQHMPPLFTNSYAQRLDSQSKLEVKEAQNGDELKIGQALIAPGDKHITLNNNGINYFIETNENEKVNRHRPSVDVLFESALRYRASKFMAIILSGMGKDGSEGMLSLKQQGAITIAQSEESSIVYGMPKEAFKSGAADYSLNIDRIISKIIAFSN